MKTTLFPFLVSAWLIGAVECKSSSPSHYERSYDFSAGEGCSDLKWTIDHEARKIILTWKSIANSQWTSFGLSENGGMRGADMALVKKRPNRKEFEVLDLVSTDFAKPQEDALQNFELLSATYDEMNRIHVVVQRDLDTCDRDDLRIESHKMYVMCASGSLTSTGEVGYHGPRRSTGSVNLMVDEERLFETTYTQPSRNGTVETLADGVSARGDVRSATSPFPVDIQMKNVTLDPNVQTNYRCRVITLPEDLRATAYEEVWGNGQSITQDPSGNSYSHHIILYACNDPNLVDPQHRNGEVWDCLDLMPACSATLASARGTGMVQIPSGLHVPVRAQTHVLLVHYENPQASPIVNDQTGLRLWVEPPSLESRTEPAGIVIHDALHESIHIPADPEQKETTRQYLISSEATKVNLPPGGVTVFAGVMHMHGRGIRGRVGLIRDGKHIRDVFDSISYDFNRQTVSYKRWQFLPGDALVVSCTYKPLPDRHIKGGSSLDDEMCSFDVAWAPETPNVGRIMGAAVRPEEAFLKSNMGETDVFAWFVNYTDYKYDANPRSNSDFEPLGNHRKNVCKIMVEDKTEMLTLNFADPAMATQIVLMCIFGFTSFLSIGAVNRKISGNNQDIRIQRNSVVYVIQISFSIVALPFLCFSLVSVYPEEHTYDAANPELYSTARSLIVMQSLLYIVELFYRVKPRLSLIFHHFLTVTTVVLLYYFQTGNYTLLALQYGLALLLLAVTEQSLYVILLLRNLGYAEKHPTTWKWICKACIFAFVATRIVVIVLIAVLVIRNSQADALVWQVSKHSFSTWIHEDGVSPTAFNTATSILLVGLICANAFALKAMLHMIRPRENDPKTSEIPRDTMLDPSETFQDQQIFEA